MKFIIIFAFMGILPTGSPIFYPNVRVYGGNSATEGQFPYIAMVMNFKTGVSTVQYQICGGTIISKRRIVTAAHCVYHRGKINSPREIFAGVGMMSSTKVTKGCVIHRIKRIFVHEYFKNYNSKDIALLETKFEIEFGPWVSKLPIADDSSVYEGGESCLIIGWGRQICSEMSSIPPVLQFAYIKILAQEDCKYFFNRLDEDIICAGLGLPKNSLGDSGGPLVCNESLAGIVSSGPKCEYLVAMPVHFVNAHTNAKWILNPTTPTGFLESTKQVAANLGIFFVSLILFIFIFIKTRIPAQQSGFTTKFLPIF